MLILAYRNLLVHKERFLLATFGVACSIVLVLFLMGLYDGWRENMESYLRHVHADVWVGQKGAADLFQTFSLLPAEGEHMFYEAEEVEKVASFVGRLLTCEAHGRRCYTFVVGVNDKDSGPVRLLEGRGAENPGEIVIDQVFARREHLALGDTLLVAGAPLRIVGIAQGGNCFLYQYAFVTLAQARQLFGLAGMVNYFLVQLADHASPEEAVARIERTSALVSAYTKEQFVANNIALTGDNFLPILRVLEILGVIVGSAVIGLTVYTLTVERGPEYGILKAIGAPDAALYTTAALQALICGICGWVLGVPSSWGLMALAQYAVPQFPAVSYLHHAAWVLGATLLMSLAAAIAPARRVARIDPAIAFKG